MKQEMKSISLQAIFSKIGKLDLFCFLKKDTGSHKTEVHLLNGDDNFTSFLKQFPTAMSETNNNYKFSVGNYNRENSVFCVEKKKTGNHSTEIKILNRENLYKDFVLNIPTKLEESGDKYDFDVGYYKGFVRVWGIKKSTINPVELHLIKI